MEASFCSPPRVSPLDAWIAGRLDGALSRETLERRQLQSLRHTLAWAIRRSPFYRDHLRGHDPAGLAGLARLAELPFTTAQDLRAQGPAMLCVSQDEVTRAVTLFSSGTSGPAKRVCFTSEDLQDTMDFFRHGMATFTAPGEVVLILLPGPRPDSVGDLLARALRDLGARPLLHGLVEDPEQAARHLVEQGATCLVGTPVQALSLLRGAGEARVPPGLVRSVLLTADYIPRAVRRALEETWGCRVFAHWGMTESGLGGGVECDARQGYHLREADLYLEVVDPASGEPLPAGREGEVVLTTLTRRGMPLIRYRTGDLATLLPEACLCGSQLRRLGRVRGRVGGEAILDGGQRLGLAELDEALFSLPELLDYQAALTRQGQDDVLEVCLTPAREPAGPTLFKQAELVLRGLLETKPGGHRARLSLSLGAPITSGAAGLAKRSLADLRAHPLPAEGTARA